MENNIDAKPISNSYEEVVNNMMIVLFGFCTFLVILEFFFDIHNWFFDALFHIYFIGFSIFIPDIIKTYKIKHDIKGKLYTNINFFRKIILLLLFNYTLMILNSHKLTVGLSDVYNFMLIEHGVLEIIYINIVGLIYVVYLLDEHLNMNVIWKLVATVAYAWCFDFFKPYGRLVDIAMDGFGALISLIISVLILNFIISFIFSKEFANILILHSLSSEYDKQQQEMDDLQRDRSYVSSDGRLSRSARNKITDAIDQKIRDHERQLQSSKQSLDDFIDYLDENNRNR